MFDFPASPTVGQIINGPGGSPYQWDGTKWTPTAFVQQPLGNTASLGTRNYLHNPRFRWWQRGAGPFSASGNLTADRFGIGLVNDTLTAQQFGIQDPGRASIGDERAMWALQSNVTGSATAGSFSQLIQRLEHLWRFSGKPVIVSFWASNGGTALSQISVNLMQYYGTGGSPTASAWLTAQIIPISGTWTRYSALFNVPSSSGKTFGSNNDSNLVLSWFLSASSAAAAGSLTQQSGTLYLWGAQLEVAQPGQTQPSAFDCPDEQTDYNNCRRFYQIGQFEVAGYSTAGGGMGYAHVLTPIMRGTPTMTSSSVTQTNCTGSITPGATANSFIPYATTTATGSVIYSGQWQASADI